MIKILIADDHLAVAEGTKNIIIQNNIVDTISIVGTIQACEETLSELQPDILILDVAMPCGVSIPSPSNSNNSIDRIPRWVKMYPDMRILVFTSYGDPSVISRAMKAGAHGFVLKDSSSNCLQEGIRLLLNGESYLCPLTECLLRNTSAPDYEPLTPREREVLALIVEGFSIKMIADRLHLGFETVHTYTKILRMKMGVNNTAALVRKALEQRLV